MLQIDIWLISAIDIRSQAEAWSLPRRKCACPSMDGVYAKCAYHCRAFRPQGPLFYIRSKSIRASEELVQL